VAKIGALPGKNIVDAFRGKLDYYTWCDLKIVRKWPRAPGRSRAPAVVATQGPFAYINKLASTLGALVIEPYVDEAMGTGLTWKDYLNRDYISGQKNFSSYQTEGPPADEYGEDMQVKILAAEVQKAVHNNINASIGWTDIDLTGEVSADATFAIMRAKLQCNSVAVVNDYGITFRQKGGAQAVDSVHWWAGVTTAFCVINDIIVPLDDQNRIQYKVDVPAGGDNVYVTIWAVGYYEQV